MKIELAEEAKKVPNLDTECFADRPKARLLFDEYIKRQLLRCEDSVRKVVIDCKGTKSCTASFIDELMFIGIFTMNYRHGNSVMVLTNLTDEFYYDLRLAVGGKKDLIESAKKEGRYFLTLDHMKAQGIYVRSGDGNYQTGSPYLLCDYKGKIEVMGFSEGEKQKRLLEQIIQGRRITAAELAEQEDISKTAANNRLNRLYERRLVFRQLKTNDSFEKYEYFFQ